MAWLLGLWQLLYEICEVQKAKFKQKYAKLL